MKYDSILYRIAEHNIALFVPNSVVTRRLLGNHEPFVVSEREFSGPVLYYIYAAQNILLPEEQYLIDTDDTRGVRSWVYKKEDDVFIKFTLGDIISKVKWDTLQNIFYTDLSFSSLYEYHSIDILTLTAFTLSTSSYKTIKIHASAIELFGNSLLFLGVSGTGKSTHSRLWLNNVPGAKLLNDDAPILRIMNDGTVRVFGSPWSGSTHCYKSVSANIVAFVQLYQSPNNDLTKLTGIEALSSLLQSSSQIRNNKVSRLHVFETITDILQTIPVYKLNCRPDLEALELTKSLLGI